METCLPHDIMLGMTSPDLPRPDIGHPEGNFSAPSIDTIRSLKQKGFIRNGSPLWWSVDYGFPPKEVVPFDEFEKRLTRLGVMTTTGIMEYAYMEARTPITVLNIEIDGENLPFFVTARPFTVDEGAHHSLPWNLSEGVENDEDLKKTVLQFANGGGILDVNHNYFPHIRGLYAGKRGDHHFFYPLQHYNIPQDNSLEALYSWPFDGNYKKITEALKRAELPPLNIYFDGFTIAYGGDKRTHDDVWDEMREKRLVDQKKPYSGDFPYKEVSAEEFIGYFRETNDDLIVFYPLISPFIESTLQLAIATRTHSASKIRKPVVLGVYAGNGLTGYPHKEGILRIKDREFAMYISNAISEDFGLEVDAVLFTPQKGRPKYERIPPKQ